MTTDPALLALRRQFFAEEVQVLANLRTPGLVEALATVPRERFLPPGPWTLRSDGDLGGPSRVTTDADPRHVYHNVVIAIDPARQLFNGQPSTVGAFIEALNLTAGSRVAHIGCGLGYYTALIARCVGPTGHVLAIEVDEPLVLEARANLREWTWIEARQGDGTDLGGGTFDAILVNAGVTHPLDAWLDALRPGGRMILPLTYAFPVQALPSTASAIAANPSLGLGPNIGKGVVLVMTKEASERPFTVRPMNFVAIYSAVGLRDDSINERLGLAFKGAPWPAIKRLRRDTHEASASCWLHSDSFCLSTV